VLHHPQSLISSSGSTTPIVRAEPPATRAWCFTARKSLFLRPEAPRLSAGPSLRRLGRGASPSANPCSFVRRHHAYRPVRASGDPGVVLHRPQILTPSSGSTTSIGRAEPPATRTWCFTARKALFLRPEAPRLSAGPSLRRPGRGASPSAKPYSFVRKHHAYRPGRASGDPDVVLHRPQSLISSSGSTTPIGRAKPPATRTWCFTGRKALFLRPEAPRLSAGPSLRRPGRGASLPVKPYSFVRKHHAYRPGQASVGVALPAKP